ncbi:MAG: LCP family protein [Defluviitaleaceae bacterium]|nr:LCP family protein [Defluviitaleaceae bacterium]
MLKKISIRRMIIAFSITLVAVIAVAGGVYAAIRALMNPPAPNVGPYIEVWHRPPGSGRNTASNNTGSSPNTSSSSSNHNYEPPPEVVTRIPRKHSQFFTFLIVGLDEQSLVDALIVGSFDARENEVNVISIPRDTRLDVQRTNRKPWASYNAGRSGGRGHEGGIAQVKSDVQSLIGFEPDFYVVIDFRAFERMVDAVNGVEIYVERRMFYCTRLHGGVVDIDIPAGRQLMSGRTALNFARYRRTITDFGRMENQQQLITALFQELLTPRTILRIPELIGIYRDYANTNLSLSDMLWFANQLPGIVSGNISTYTLPIARTERQGWYEMPCEEGILELVNRTVNPFARDITAEMLRIVR